MKIGRCQVISLNETILLHNDIVSCALFVLFYPMPFAPVFIAIYIKEEMAYGTLNLISSWNISYIFRLLMTMDKVNYIIYNLPRFVYEFLYVFINKIIIWKNGTRQSVTHVNHNSMGPNDYETASKYFIVSKFKLTSFGTAFFISCFWQALHFV